MSTRAQCKAKDPVKCRYHGKKFGIEANIVVQRVLDNDKHKSRYNAEQLRSLTLKQMNATTLALAVKLYAKETPGIDTNKVNEAMKMASHLHRTDIRSNRAQYNVTPYIEHPLRNTLRIARYGCKREVVLLGSILHDTVEDHPFEISEEYYGKKAETEEEARANSYAYIEKTYGKEVSKMVEGMSNPISEGEQTAEEKINTYVAHLTEAIEDPDVCIGKIGDVVDNAVGLHHNLKGNMTPASIGRKARKYLRAWPALEARIERDRKERKLPVSDEGFDAIVAHLRSGRKSLEKLAKL
jgi:(p)ppGpp synthase/HD superfamily hydrolase